MDQPTVANVRAALASGDVQAAASALRAVFRDDALGGAGLPDALTVLRDVCAAAGVSELAACLGRVTGRRWFGLRGPTVADWHRAGVEAVDVGLPEAAVHLLRAGLALAPDHVPSLTTLAAAQGHLGRDAHAARALAEAPPTARRDPTLRALQAHHTLLTGDLTAARALVAELDRANPTVAELARTLDLRLARADAVAGVTALDPHDLRGWHFVLTGGVLLHRSPHGLDEPMLGRWAFVQDSYEGVAQGLRRLVEVLPVLGVTPRRVLHARDPGSHIVATAAARLLDLPLAPLDGGEGLVVLDDLGDLEPDEAELLHRHRPGQVLFANALCWTNPPPFAPDLVTMLYEMRTAPWGAQMRVEDGDDGEREVRMSEPDERDAETLATVILEAGPGEDEGDPVALVLALAEAGAAVAAARRSEGAREAEPYGGGPVKSARFN